MDTNDIDAVQSSFAKVVPIADTAAALFYTDLFATAPDLEPYFAHADMAEQGSKLMATLSVVVNGLRDLTKIAPVAEDLARRHVTYGVKTDDYDKVGASLLRTLEKGLGTDWTPETAAAWTKAYTTLASVMIAAAYSETAR